MKECDACGFRLPTQATRCHICRTPVPRSSIWTRPLSRFWQDDATPTNKLIAVGGTVLSTILFGLLFGSWLRNISPYLEGLVYTVFSMIVIGLLSSLQRTGEKSLLETYRNEDGLLVLPEDDRYGSPARRFTYEPFTGVPPHGTEVSSPEGATTGMGD